MREELKDSRNQRVGYIDRQLNGKITVYDKNNVRLGEIRPEGSYLVAYDKTNRRMGKWNENDDYTYDSNNRRIGKGNLLIPMYFQ
ncbi:MAG: hypothetical protein IJH82_06850 [Lachnospiraceae bacterium]|nr:hypothetical protein [Lachnospiraceae bacterium]